MSVAVLVLFVLHQRWRGRAGRTPLLDLSIFRRRAVSVGLLVTLGFYAAFLPFFFVFALPRVNREQIAGIDDVATL